MDQRTLTTLLHILRHTASEQRRVHGHDGLIERTDGVMLTPSEMERLADYIETGALDLTM